MLPDRIGATGRSLLGKRVVVTRPADSSSELCSILAEHGASVIKAPSVRIVELPLSGQFEDALRNLSRYGWVVFTSARAVRAFKAAARNLGIGSGAIASRIAVVGPATGKAVTDTGYVVSFAARGHTATDLASELPGVDGAEVLFPCAQTHAEALQEILEARGAEVRAMPVYRTESVPLCDETVTELRKGFDIGVFTSGSTFRGFTKGLREALGDKPAESLLRRSHIACIGQLTASAVAEEGFHADIVASEHTAAGLIEAIDERFGSDT